MLPTGLVAHERYFWHDPGRGAGFSTSSIYVQPDRHPEDPDTKRRLLALLEVSGQLDHLLRIAPRPATMEELLSFHTPRYIEHVRTLSEGVGGDAGDSATVGHGSYEIALLSTGGCLAAGEAVLGGRARNAYALVRPPGHHAEADSGRGYCLFGNAVILVKQARQQHGAARVAVRAAPTRPPCRDRAHCPTAHPPPAGPPSNPDRTGGHVAARAGRRRRPPAAGARCARPTNGPRPGRAMSSRREPGVAGRGDGGVAGWR